MTPESDFTIAKTVRGSAQVITLSGELDIATSPQLRAALMEGDEADHLVIVDLTMVSFIDSTALSALILGYKQRRNRGSDLRLVGVQPQVARVFEVTGLTEVFSTYEDIDDALSLSSPGSECSSAGQ